MTIKIDGIKRVVIDSEESLLTLHEKALLYIDGESFVLSTDAMVDKLFASEQWKSRYHEENRKVQQMKTQLRDLERRENATVEAIDVVPKTANPFATDVSKVLVSKRYRNGQGRFLTGHKTSQPRNNKGRFTKKIKEKSTVHSKGSH